VEALAAAAAARSSSGGARGPRAGRGRGGSATKAKPNPAVQNRPVTFHTRIASSGYGQHRPPRRSTGRGGRGRAGGRRGSVSPPRHRGRGGGGGLAAEAADRRAARRAAMQVRPLIGSPCLGSCVHSGSVWRRDAGGGVPAADVAAAAALAAGTGPARWRDPGAELLAGRHETGQIGRSQRLT
jgi:hypothetical protein